MTTNVCKQTQQGIAAFLLAGILALAGCGKSDTPTPPDPSAAPSKAIARADAAPAQTPSEKKGSERLQQLMNVWADAGINVEFRNTLQSGTLNAMFGCRRQYEIFLNERMVIVLEYDLAKLDGTGQRNLDFIVKNGRQSQNNEPAWKSAEFVLVNSAKIIENGEVLQHYNVTEHPDQARILAAFHTFN